MASKIVALCTLFAAANAGLLPGAVTTYSAAPLVRYSPATEVSHSYSSIAAPAAFGYAAQAYAAPAYAAQAYAAPAYAAQAYAAPSYAAPAYTSSVYAAPAYAAQTYAAPAYTSAAYAAPIAKAVSYGPASVAVSAPAIGSTQQSVIRSFDGTVSQHSKAVDTAFSSVRKYDSRVNNNVYTPSIAKTYAYAAPAPAVYAQAAPAVVAHNTPVLTAHAPALYSAHATPAVTAYATKALSYSPASTVAHVSFNGYGATYGW